MEKEFIIINKTAIQKRIEELEDMKDNPDKLKDPRDWSFVCGQLDILNFLLSNSTPLIPEIEKAIQFGKDIRSEKSFINPNFDSPFVDYEDSTEETTKYISQLKLDI